MERLRAARIRTISYLSAGLIMLRLSCSRTFVVGAVQVDPSIQRDREKIGSWLFSTTSRTATCPIADKKVQAEKQTLAKALRKKTEEMKKLPNDVKKVQAEKDTLIEAICNPGASPAQQIRKLEQLQTEVGVINSVTALRSSLSDRRESPTRKSLVTPHAGDSIRVSIHRLRLPGCNKAAERHRGIVRYLNGAVRVSDSCRLERPNYFFGLKIDTIYPVPFRPSTVDSYDSCVTKQTSLHPEPTLIFRIRTEIIAKDISLSRSIPYGSESPPNRVIMMRFSDETAERNASRTFDYQLPCPFRVRASRTS